MNSTHNSISEHNNGDSDSRQSMRSGGKSLNSRRNAIRRGNRSICQRIGPWEHTAMEHA